MSTPALTARLRSWLGREGARQEATDRARLADLLTAAARLDAFSAVDQRALQSSAERHGVLGLLPVEGAAVKGLQTRSMRALRFSRRAVAAVEAVGVPCVVLKGVAIAARWREPWARQQSDLDLLVDRKNLKAASSALIDAGVASREFLAGEHMHNAALTPREPSGLLIELHHSLSGSHEVRADIRGLLERRIRVTTAQGDVPTLSLEDDAAYLAMHAATHTLERLAWLVDLEGLGRAGVDWVEAARRAKDWNVAPPVECAWREARQLLSIPIPEAAFEALGTSRVQRAVIEALFQAAEATAGTSRGLLERVYRMALVRPVDWPQRAIHLMRARREGIAAYGLKTTGA